MFPHICIRIVVSRLYNKRKIQLNEVEVFLIIYKHSTQHSNDISFEKDQLNVKIKKIAFLLNEKLKMDDYITRKCFFSCVTSHVPNADIGN